MKVGGARPPRALSRTITTVGEGPSGTIISVPIRSTRRVPTRAVSEKRAPVMKTAGSVASTAGACARYQIGRPSPAPGFIPFAGSQEASTGGPAAHWYSS